jgi:hypothetical protein
MRLNKLEKLDLRYSLPKVKRFKPIQPPTREEWEMGDTMNSINLICLNVRLLLNAKIINESDMDDGEINLYVNNAMKTVSRIFECIDNGYMMKTEFDTIKRDFNIRFDDD